MSKLEGKEATAESVSLRHNASLRSARTSLSRAAVKSRGRAQVSRVSGSSGHYLFFGDSDWRRGCASIDGHGLA
jgi:hypothetical protein